ncbi:MAG: recombination mediator RecR [Candidatus Eisenbacteria bacterium]|nr:recombination mediator RecR [Candidatus Eisenbacteria bacterium]
MKYSSQLVEKLIEELAALPGIGRKSAQRIAFHLMRVPREDASRLSDAIMKVKDSVRYCGVCWNITEVEPCHICKDGERNLTEICVVEMPNDALAVEGTGEYRGTYHVLHGAISPLDGIGPENLKIKELLKRLEDGRVREVIVATNPSVQGEATALYLRKVIARKDLRVTRIARGISVGTDLEYADKVTLARALEGRKDME